MGGSHCKSAPCLVVHGFPWCLWVFCKWRYNIFNLSQDLSWPPHWGTICIYGWEFFLVCHHPDKSCDHKRCESGAVFNLSCDLSWTNVYRYIWIYGWKPLTASHHLACLVAISLVQVEIWSIQYVIWPQKTMRLMDQVTLWVVALLGISLPC